jgi:hypothetical protein
MAPTGGPDFASRAADTLEVVVDAIHDRAIRPAILVARVLVYGIVIGVIALVIGVVVSIGVVRLLDVYAFGGRVWASDALLGLILCAAGGVAWRKRRPPVED